MGCTRRRVLIIEDQRLVAEALAAFVRALGHAVAGPVSTGRDAVDLARRARPDLILSDLNLQKAGDGAEAVCRILEEGPVPVAFITATPEAVPRTGLLCDVVVLAKPVSPDRLCMAVGQLLDPESVGPNAIAAHRSLALAVADDGSAGVSAPL